MKDLSIIICGNEKEIKEFLETFRFVLESREVEIIIITKKLKDLKIPYSHFIYEPSMDYRKLKEFCFYSSQGKRVLILERGIKVSFSLAKKIQDYIEDDTLENLNCLVKRYLSIDKNSYVEEDLTLVYNRGIKGFNRHIAMILEDYSFLDFDLEDIRWNVIRFLKDRKFEELYSWYENVILNLEKEYAIKFYEVLEEEKTCLGEVDNIFLEEIFLSKDNSENYFKYLKIKKILREKCMGYYGNAKRALEQADLTEEDTYFNHLTGYIFTEAPETFDILSRLKPELMEKFLEILLSNNSFQESVYDFIDWQAENICKSNVESIELYLHIVEIYIKAASKHPVTFETKDRLIGSISKYLKILSELQLSSKIGELQKNYGELAIKAGRIIKGLGDNRIHDSISLLKELMERNSWLATAAAYYIQSLRFKYNIYPFILSICMIVRDEEKYLEKCLLSIKPLLDMKLAELIIVDTGSKDKTLEIAEKYTERVISHPWKNSFSEARNFSISLAEGEYVFIYDADGEIEKSHLSQIVKTFKEMDFRSFNTFTLAIKNYTDINSSAFTMFTQPLIFKNDGTFFYWGSVHNQPRFKAPVKNLPVILHHYGYIMTDEIRDKKFNRTATLLKRELEKNPGSIYYRFQLSTSYAMHGDFKESLEQVNIYMRHIKEEGEFNDNYLMYYNHAALIYFKGNMLEETLKVCDEALGVCPDFIDFIFYKASILFRLEKYKLALEYINRYLEMIDKFLELPVAKDGRFSFSSLACRENVVKMFIISNYRLRDYGECIKGASLIKDNKTLWGCLYCIIDSFIKTSKIDELCEFYKEKVSSSGDADIEETFKCFLINLLLRSMKESREAFLSCLSRGNMKEGFVADIRNRLEASKYPDIEELLLIVEKYDIDSLNLMDAIGIFEKIIPVYEAFDISNNVDFERAVILKRFGQFFLHRAGKLMHFSKFNLSNVVSAFQKYMSICTKLIGSGRRNLLEPRERLFLGEAFEAFNSVKVNEMKKAFRNFKEAETFYPEMQSLIELTMKITIPQENMELKPKGEVLTGGEDSEELRKRISTEVFTYLENNDIEGALDVFDKYDEKNLYDAVLYSLRSLLLMSRDMITKAEETLKEGLNKYPGDESLLVNLSKIYALKKEYKKSIEIYVRARLLSNDNSLFKITEILPEKFYSNNSPRVLHGSMFSSDKISELSSFLNSNYIYSRTFNYFTKDIGYSSDFVLDAGLLDDGKEILERSVFAASRLISEFDIFHFHSGNTLSFTKNDLDIIKELNKKIIFQFWGYDVRRFSIASRFSPYIKKEMVENEDKILRKLEILSKYTSKCIVPDEEVKEYVRDFFEEIMVIPSGLNLNKYIPSSVNRRNRFLIVHAPTSKGFKGSNYTMGVMEKLKGAYDFEFKVIQGIPHDEAVKTLKAADLIIDQVLIGTCGQLAIEAMALGKPVICYISDCMKDKYPEEIPVISASPDNLEDTLKQILKNRDMLKLIGDRGRAYVEKYHDMRRVTGKLLSLYNKVGK